MAQGNLAFRSAGRRDSTGSGGGDHPGVAFEDVGQRRLVQGGIGCRLTTMHASDSPEGARHRREASGRRTHSPDPRVGAYVRITRHTSSIRASGRAETPGHTGRRAVTIDRTQPSTPVEDAMTPPRCRRRKLGPVYEWVLQRVSDSIRGRTVEVGAGIGTMSARIEPLCTELVLVEPAPNLCHQLTNGSSICPR